MLNTGTTTVPKVLVSKGPNKGTKQQYQPDKGKLPGCIPEPSFVANPNHRKKVLTGELHDIAKKNVAERLTMTKMDCTRIGKNFGYMITTLNKRPEEEWRHAADAILEHHFDNHIYCGAWCPRKRMTVVQLAASGRYYRNKADASHQPLYDMLKKVVDRFTTMERLRECAHGMDTQINESFNNTTSWFAPKNKVYCGLQSLENQLSMAIGIGSLGLERYFHRLFILLSISMKPNITHFLTFKELLQTKRHNKNELTSTKKNCIKVKMDVLKEHKEIARQEHRKQQGASYQPGQNMDANRADGYTEQDLLTLIEQAKKRPRHNSNNNKATCPFCNLKGHTTTRSSKCLLHSSKNNKKHEPTPGVPIVAKAPPDPPEDETAALNAYKCDALSAFQLNNAASASSNDTFVDAATWSSDDDSDKDVRPRGVL
jgi:hypothetical protein